MAVSSRFQGWLLVGAQFVLLAVLALVPAGEAWPLPSWARTAGSLLRGVGAALIVIGALRLGLAASIFPAPTASATLRTTGPYRLVRHPIYTGVLVFAAAMTVSARSIIAALAWITLLTVLHVKARFEEGLLVRRFPEYRSYARATGRFLPRLSR